MLIYLTRVDATASGAQAKQIRAMSEAFEELLGSNFNLVSAGSQAWAGDGPSNWEKVPPAAGRWRRQLQFARLAANTIRQHPTATIFTRDIGLAATSALLGANVAYESHQGPNSLGAHWLSRWLARSPRFHLVAISQALANHYLQRYPQLMGRILVAHDAVKAEDYPAEEAKTHVTGLNLETLRIVHTGSLYKGGGEQIIELARLGGHRIELLHVGGSADECKALEATGQARGAQLSAVPQSPKEVVVKLQRTASALLYIASRSSSIYWCTSPLKLFEYMATGKPILAARIGSVAEIIDESTAFCYDPDVPGTLETALTSMLSSPDEAKARGQRARALVLERHTWRSRGQSILNFLPGVQRQRPTT
jgi:hypothetical protein